MANKMIECISQRLNEVFNQRNEYEIYGEEIKQGLIEPCFFIGLLQASQKQEVGKRYFLSQSFDVHYFPKSELNSKQEMLQMAESLFEALEYIDCDETLVRGTNMKYEIIEDVLHFFVDYNFYVVREQKKEDCFENFNYNGEVKNE